MEVGGYQSWLRKEKWTNIIVSVLLGPITLTVGAVVLFLIFWFSYYVIFVVTELVTALSEFIGISMPSSVRGWNRFGAGLVVTLVFFGHLFWSQPGLSDTGVNRLMRISPLAGRALGFLQGLFRPSSAGQMIADTLFSGPRLVVATLVLGWGVIRWLMMDIAGCAKVLQTLHASEGAVSKEEINHTCWQHDLERLIRDFRLMRGVNEVGATDLALGDDLRGRLDEKANRSGPANGAKPKHPE